MHTTQADALDAMSRDLLTLLEKQDPCVAAAMALEATRQTDTLELIASENHVTPAVMHTMGSWLTNKYAEGYPSKRYYGGCEHHDVIEDLARDRAKELFGCRFANVQPHSGANANVAAFMAMCKPGDRILSLPIKSGGHLSHGLKPNFSGTFYEIHDYELDSDSELLDYDHIAQRAGEVKPRMIICGYSAYPRAIDFERFRAIADDVGAVLMADIAHIAGLVAGGAHASPFPHAHIVTTTTHKTLRGPRGGLILCDDPEIAKLVDRKVFPGSQGGPLMHVIAAKAAGFLEALQPEFKDYIKSVLANAKMLAETLKNNGFKIYSNGTDTHLMLVDLRPYNVKGNLAAESLSRANITCNKNGIPFDTEKPMITSGIRLGTQAATTRGFGLNEFKTVGELITKTLKGLSENPNDNSKVENEVKNEVISLTSSFPIYKNL
mgnify:CR=1 FL=1